MYILRRLEKLYKFLPPLLIRDLKEKFAGSHIGLIWALVQPLLIVILFTVVFSKIFKVRVHFGDTEMPFFIYLFTGLFPWFAIQEGIMRGASSIVDKGFLIKKVLYPAELFPINAVISAVVQHGIGFFLFLVWFFLAYKGDIRVLHIIGLPLLISTQIMLTMGFAFLLAALTVYVRDIVQILGVVLQGVFFLTPIVFSMSSVPENLKRLILLNPFALLIEGYHSIILYNTYSVDGKTICLISFAALIFSSGLYIFRKLKKGFADVL